MGPCCHALLLFSLNRNDGGSLYKMLTVVQYEYKRMRLNRNPACSRMHQGNDPSSGCTNRLHFVLSSPFNAGWSTAGDCEFGRQRPDASGRRRYTRITTVLVDYPLRTLASD